MSSDSLSSRDPVEQLLRVMMRRVLGGTAVTGALLSVGACSSSQPVHARELPAKEADRGGLTAGDPGGGSAGQPDANLARPDGGLAAPEGEAVVCEANVWFAVHAGGLRPSEPYDYLAIRHLDVVDPMPDGDGSWTLGDELFSVLSETGTACATATDDACAEKVAHHPNILYPKRCIQICDETSVVTTQGDDVRRFATVDELRALLGTVDSIDDALLLVHAAEYWLTCNDATRTTVAEVDDGYIVYATRTTQDCAPIVETRYRLHVSKTGEITELGQEELTREDGACIGRKPEGLVEERGRRGEGVVADYLARCAHLEAASVVAFERLADELRQHGAPPALIESALAARSDEIAHARTVTRLAEGYGGHVQEVHVSEVRVRSLEAIAIENAVEGCVRETYGAFVGAVQAAQAQDLKVRREMRQIASDETRHAALSHRVHHWAMSQLDAAARMRVLRAMTRAVDELRAEVQQVPDPALAMCLGLPSPAGARAILDELTRGLWSAELRGHDWARA